ncbi:MAG TPA: hypothetical protein VNS09_06645 [Solirubrobacter sp.]|nr:hypothetical protein [Solirubrobacter sp.]
MAEKRSKPAGVLGTLPASRPERLGHPRREPRSAAPAEPAAAKRRPAPKRAPAKPRPAAIRPPRPAAVRPAAPPLRPRHAAEPPPEPLAPPTGTELVTTTIRAAGELAQIGLSAGGRALRRTLDRLPRP